MPKSRCTKAEVDAPTMKQSAAPTPSQCARAPQGEPAPRAASISRRSALAGCIFLALSRVGYALADGNKALCLNTAFGPPIFAPDGSGFFNLLMAEATRRIGLSVEIDAPPAERALVNANAGIVDGDGPRIHDLRDIGSYPNLLRVPEELLVVEFVAFSRSRPISAATWSSLFPYNVGIVRGWKILEQNITEARSLVRTKTARQLFRLLASERVEVAVIDRLSGLAAARELAIDDIAVSEEALARRPMYLHLHKRHAELIEPLTAALAAIKADGTYARIQAQALDPLLAPPTPATRER